jgi:hypothetical protein
VVSPGARFQFSGWRWGDIQVIISFNAPAVRACSAHSPLRVGI